MVHETLDSLKLIGSRRQMCFILSLVVMHYFTAVTRWTTVADKLQNVLKSQSG